MEETKVSRLRLERLSRGWSLKDVAEIVGVTPAAVKAWEMETSKPAVDSAIKLSQLYKVDVAELFYTQYCK